MILKDIVGSNQHLINYFSYYVLTSLLALAQGTITRMIGGYDLTTDTKCN